MNRDRPPRSPAPKLPLRFGIRDGLAAMLLFAVQLTYISKILHERVRYQTRFNLVFVAAVFSGAITFGAAYLASRHATTHKINGFGLRAILLIVCDIMLLASPLALAVLVVLWPLTLIFLFAWMLLRINPSNKKPAQHDEGQPERKMRSHPFRGEK